MREEVRQLALEINEAITKGTPPEKLDAQVQYKDYVEALLYVSAIAFDEAVKKMENLKDATPTRKHVLFGALAADALSEALKS